VRSVYFDVMSGASGDMILSSLIDAGMPIAWLQEQFGKLDLPGLKVEVERQKRSGITAAHLLISYETPSAFRHLSQILSVIQKGGFSDAVNERCKKVLNRLAEAEAAVHGIPADRVHFHEVGAVDTIIDVLGASLGFEYLGVEEVLFSTLTEGHGTITVAHGVMPVPAPATAAMMRGFAVRTLDIPTELLTPTGCAILTSLGKQVPTMPAGNVKTIGYGCGDKQFEHHPNILRALLMDSRDDNAGTGTVTVIESDMDHVTGEIMGFTADLLMHEGALDVSWSPVFMKKGRPGYHLCVVCDESLREKLIDLVISQTRTLGVRYQSMQRTVAERSVATVDFEGKPAVQKTCSYKGHSFKKLEYEALAALSRETGKPLIELMEEYIKKS
jgi:pyridinium-3,5-bisthiocarboxylic acid mononucleotide nickel chelatase